MESDHVCEIWYDGRKIGVATDGKMADALIEAEKQRIRREESEKSLSKRDLGHDWDRRNRRCRRCQMGEADFEDQNPKEPCQRHMEKSDPKVILVSLSRRISKFRLRWRNHASCLSRTIT